MDKKFSNNKTCDKCNIELPIVEFNRDISKKMVTKTIVSHVKRRITQYSTWNSITTQTFNRFVAKLTEISKKII